MAKKPTPTQIITALNVLTGLPGYRKFNDPIGFGRSYKVWGWTLKHYHAAIELLEAHGYKVELKLTNGIKIGRGPGLCGELRAPGSYRLWVG